MKLIKNPLFYLALILVLLAAGLAVNFVKAVNRAAEQPFSEPSPSLPGGDWEFPIDVGFSNQTKKGQLTVNKLFIKTSTPENSPVYLSEDGIWMKKNSDAKTPSSKIYWDDITGGWSNTGGGIYYDKGGVSIGTSTPPDTGVELNLEGRLDMNGNRITRVGSPNEYSDAATKGYTDSKVGIKVISDDIYKDEYGCSGHSYGIVNYFDEFPERTPHSVHGKLWDISTEWSTSEWDFCFLTHIEYDSCGDNNFKQLKTMACEVMKGYGYVNADGPLIGDGGWYLRVATDDRSHTRCVARCVNFR